MYVKLSWRPEVDEKSHNCCTAGNVDLPDYGFLLLTWTTAPMEWSTGNSYQAEALINVFRYHACRSSHPEGRKLPITELKWEARTLTDIPGNTAHWFFAFFWVTEGSRNKNENWAIMVVQRQFWPTRPWLITSDLLNRSYGMIYGE
jgi:hypothetical protein